MTITIWHNPNCSNSRNALSLIRAAGQEPQIVEYLKTPPSRAELMAVIKKMALRPSDLVRSKEKLFQDLGLSNSDDEQLLDAMVTHPSLINRPIVITNKGAKLCRPPELVKDLLQPD